MLTWAWLPQCVMEFISSRSIKPKHTHIHKHKHPHYWTSGRYTHRSATWSLGRVALEGQPEVTILEPTHGGEPMVVNAVMEHESNLLCAFLCQGTQQKSLSHTALHAGLVILATVTSQTEAQGRASAKVDANQKQGCREMVSLPTGNWSCRHGEEKKLMAKMIAQNIPLYQTEHKRRKKRDVGKRASSWIKLKYPESHNLQIWPIPSGSGGQYDLKPQVQPWKENFVFSDLKTFILGIDCDLMKGNSFLPLQLFTLTMHFWTTVTRPTTGMLFCCQHST